MGRGGLTKKGYNTVITGNYRHNLNFLKIPKFIHSTNIYHTPESSIVLGNRDPVTRQHNP